MRVLHVISNLGTYGAERFLALLLERFSDPAIQLGVLTVAGAPAGPAPVPIFSAGRRGRIDALFLPKMIAAIRGWRPDIVHTHTHHGKYWGRMAAIAACVPTIVHTEHNSEFGAPAPFRILDRALMSRTDAVITFSDAQRERLVRDDGVSSTKLVIIPNGIALLPFDSTARSAARALMGADDGDVLIVNVGRLARVKNQRLAIETLAALGVKRARLVLIGDGTERADLEGLAKERGVSDRVAFMGYREDAAHLVFGADVALVTSLNESFSLAAIEAMNARVPLVSVPWDGAEALLGRGAYGLVAPSYDHADVAAAVRAVLDQPEVAHARSMRGFEHTRERYDIGTTARLHGELYRSLEVRKRTAARRA
jgi:glycosyltransferase involved in cell wall biosynthesis